MNADNKPLQLGLQGRLPRLRGRRHRDNLFSLLDHRGRAIQAKNQAVQLSHHVLAITDPDSSLDFYTSTVGMTLVASRVCGGRSHYFLGFVASDEADNPVPPYPACLLELVFDPACREIDNQGRDGVLPGYWKIALSVADLELARQSLLRRGVRVSEAVQVPDVAYLCHFDDPDGYCIELIQHRMRTNHQAEAPDDRYALATPTCFSLITVRVRDPEQSIEFYRRELGLRLVSRQQLAERGFTLYFLSADRETPPSDDIDDIDMREWLWQRPYALLELQHIWGTEQRAEFAYRSDAATGFEKTRWLVEELSGEASVDACLSCAAIERVDPDGYRLQLLRATRGRSVDDV